MPQPEPGFSDEERELLRSAELDAPGPEAQGRTLSALGIGAATLGSGVALASGAKAASLSAGGGATNAAGATTALGAGKALAFGKLLAVVVAGSVAGGAALHYRGQARAPEALVARPNTPMKPAALVAKPAPAESPPESSAPAPTSARSAAKLPTTAGPGRPEPDIALEIESLDRARRAEARGDFTTALAELEQYERAFKQGRLRPEALLLRVKTLLGKGDTAGAKALGGRFLARYPQSPLAPRIQNLIGSAK